MGASFHRSYTVLKESFDVSKNKSTSLGTLSQTPGFEKFASAYPSLKRVIDLARQGGRSERDKLDRHRSAELTLPLSSDRRPLVYRQALSRARFRRAGQLATVDTSLELLLVLCVYALLMLIGFYIYRVSQKKWNFVQIPA